MTCRTGFELKNGACEEICGDGIKFTLPCDDNNSVSGDGCSAECKIEDNWSCEGGSPNSQDRCTQFEKADIISEIEVQGPIDLKMVGMSHLYGKIILNVKLSYIPEQLLNSFSERDNIFKVLTNSKISVRVASSYIDSTKYTYVVVYDFKKVEPIPEFLTRVELEAEIKEKYFPHVEVRPLFIKINPAYMARNDQAA